MSNLDDQILRMHVNVLGEKYGASLTRDPKRLAEMLSRAAPELANKVDDFIAGLNLPVATEPSGASSSWIAEQSIPASDAVAESKLSLPKGSASTSAVKPGFVVVGALAALVGASIYAHFQRVQAPPVVAAGPPPQTPPAVRPPPTTNPIQPSPPAAQPRQPVNADPKRPPVQPDRPASPPALPRTAYAGQKLAEDLIKGPPDRMFGGRLLRGPSESKNWYGSVDQQGYRIQYRGAQRNTADNRMIYNNPSDVILEDEIISVFSIEADVAIEGNDPLSRAGLIFGYSAKSKSEYVLEIGKTYTNIIRYSTFTDGYTPSVNIESDDVNIHAGWNKLKIQITGRGVEFFVNGKRLDYIGDAPDAFTSGFIVEGPGSFRFRNLVRILG